MKKTFFYDDLLFKYFKECLDGSFQSSNCVIDYNQCFYWKKNETISNGKLFIKQRYTLYLLYMRMSGRQTLSGAMRKFVTPP